MERSANDKKTIKKITEQRESAKTQTEDETISGRIIKQPLKRKGHVTMALCSDSGNLEKWTLTKSHDPQSYHDARKAVRGDIWSLPAKTVTSFPSNTDPKLLTRLENYEEDQKQKVKMLRKLKDRRDKKQIKLRNYEVLNKGYTEYEDTPEEMIGLYTDNFNISKRQRQKDKKGGIENAFMEKQ
ncbi:hypothetical protein WICPIJ_005454 [Wickerhamomyces pijperi]|uniref:Uncharacterized protein n=1 Tax=Wickerhamomyces pijperi TaxID=599730 RepID=A0A9P8Q5S6_WICPI|nr:hypothetical protein WICPIJ_005454 [Wickerhamomyces pijperi]